MDNIENVDTEELKKQILESGHWIKCEILVDDPGINDDGRGFSIPYIKVEANNSSVVMAYALVETLKRTAQNLRNKNKAEFNYLDKIMKLKTSNIYSKDTISEEKENEKWTI